MPEPIENQYFKVGRIEKAHGLDGTVVILPEGGAVSIFESGELVRLQNENGDLIPARIETSRFQQKNERRSFLVKFAHISDKNQARQLRKIPVFVDRDKVGNTHDSQPLKKLISYEVCNEENREVGMVKDVLDNPAHPILVVQSDSNEVLVPLVDEYITEIDEDNEIVYCQKMNQLAEIA